MNKEKEETKKQEKEERRRKKEERKQKGKSFIAFLWKGSSVTAIVFAVTFVVSEIIQSKTVDIMPDITSLTFLQTYLIVFSVFLSALGIFGYSSVKDILSKDIDISIDNAIENKIAPIIKDLEDDVANRLINEQSFIEKIATMVSDRKEVETNLDNIAKSMPPDENEDEEQDSNKGGT